VLRSGQDVKYCKRHVFHIAGYDPATPGQVHQRFSRQFEIFKRTWNVKGTVTSLDSSSTFPCWSLSTRGANWASDTTFELLAWDDLIAQASRRPVISRLARTCSTYLDLLFTGTLARYLFANARYFAFAVIPLLQAIALGVLSYLIASYTTEYFIESLAVRYLCTALIAAGLFFIFLQWAGPRWRMFQAFDDWILSLDYIKGRDRDLDRKIDQFAARIASCVDSDQLDEIIVLGHSLGATLAVDAVARALDTMTSLAKHRAKLCLVTVGATIPKCALHPDGQRIRGQISKVAGEQSLYWVEYQAREDAISFYRCDPASLKRITGHSDRVERKPIIRRVHIKNMMSPSAYKRFRLRVLRLHYQFVSANDIRTTYDYFMLICGPLFVMDWAASNLGFLQFFRDSQTSSVEF
jgi:pimeloyl-ACP methyl ester carboxylesterase